MDNKRFHLIRRENSQAIKGIFTCILKQKHYLAKFELAQTRDRSGVNCTRSRVTKISPPKVKTLEKILAN